VVQPTCRIVKDAEDGLSVDVVVHRSWTETTYQEYRVVTEDKFKNGWAFAPIWFAAGGAAIAIALANARKPLDEEDVGGIVAGVGGGGAMIAFGVFQAASGTLPATNRRESTESEPIESADRHLPLAGVTVGLRAWAHKDEHVLALGMTDEDGTTTLELEIPARPASFADLSDFEVFANSGTRLHHHQPTRIQIPGTRFHRAVMKRAFDERVSGIRAARDVDERSYLLLVAKQMLLDNVFDQEFVEEGWERLCPGLRDEAKRLGRSEQHADLAWLVEQLPDHIEACARATDIHELAQLRAIEERERARRPSPILGGIRVGGPLPARGVVLRSDYYSTEQYNVMGRVSVAGVEVPGEDFTMTVGDDGLIACIVVAIPPELAESAESWLFAHWGEPTLFDELGERRVHTWPDGDYFYEWRFNSWEQASVLYVHDR